MITSSKAKIFLKEKRDIVVDDGLKVYNSFITANDVHPGNLPFGSLTVFNEIILEAGKSIAILPEENTRIILLTMEGVVAKIEEGDKSVRVEKGQALSFTIENKKPVILRNHSNVSVCQFLQIGIKEDTTFYKTDRESLMPIPLSVANSLIPLFNASPHEESNFFMGKFSGRQEAIRRIKQQAAGVFVFVLQGAFEVQNRLMEEKDGLLIWDVEAIELEALSNDAVILLIEQPIL